MSTFNDFMAHAFSVCVLAACSIILLQTILILWVVFDLLVSLRVQLPKVCANLRIYLLEKAAEARANHDVEGPR